MAFLAINSLKASSNTNNNRGFKYDVIGDFHKVAFYVIFSFCSQQLWMENAPSVFNHLLNPLSGESDAVKGIRIVQKGNNSAKAVFIESREGRHNGKMKRMRSASRTYN